LADIGNPVAPIERAISPPSMSQILRRNRASRTRTDAQWRSSREISPINQVENSTDSQTISQFADGSQSQPSD
jgi:hypothetical protein